MSEFNFREDILIPWFTGIGTPAKEAYSLLSEHGINNFNDVETLAKRLGIEITYTANQKFSSRGVSFLHGNEKHIIINKRWHPLTAKFTIAHEIAHHILHLNKGIVPDDALQEIQADIFAIVVLFSKTPHQELIEYIRINPEANIYPRLIFLGSVGILAIEGIRCLLKFLFQTLAPTNAQEVAKQIPINNQIGLTPLRQSWQPIKSVLSAPYIPASQAEAN